MKRHYTTAPGMPYPQEATTCAYIAMRILLGFKGRTPTAAELQREFGMSRATAYRWRSAISAARGEQMSEAA